MSWQTLLISNPCKLSIKNGNILLRRLDDEDANIAISKYLLLLLKIRK
ncbi:MAG: hypothetical protein H0A76_13200 [Candidatus Thiodubiliella endoseptemdiera]|uniref:Uncharacterized protein n=1 Tax=Candidatus Thiodubiliella endoseptemdiera TaxID=2738886 RepID=A0A853F4Y4_9GAMM|nr:hypothetical protein [Candidatus Thiodubiliella endoseptemdiera]